MDQQKLQTIWWKILKHNSINTTANTRQHSQGEYHGHLDSIYTKRPWIMIYILHHDNTSWGQEVEPLDSIHDDEWYFLINTLTVIEMETQWLVHWKQIMNQFWIWQVEYYIKVSAAIIHRVSELWCDDSPVWNVVTVGTKLNKDKN